MDGIMCVGFYGSMIICQWLSLLLFLILFRLDDALPLFCSLPICLCIENSS